MLKNLSVAKRLLILLAAGALLLAAIAAIGWLGMSQMTRSLETVYKDRAEPLVGLSKIMSLFDGNYADIMRAFQHDPEGKTVHLHDHPVTEHTDRILGYQKDMDRIWAEYMATYLTEEEKQLAADFAEKRKQYEANIVDPALDALKQGNYSAEVMGAFLKGNRTLGGPTRKALESLIGLQARVAKEEFETAKATYRRDQALFVTLLVVGLSGIGVFAFFLIRSITIPLAQAARVSEAVAQGDLTQTVPVGGRDEIGRLLGAMANMQQELRGMMAGLQHNAQDLDQAARELSDSAGRSAEASETQSEAASSMAASVEEMSVSIDHVRENAREAHGVSVQAGEQSRTGRAIVHKAADEIGQIAEAVNTSARTIGELEAVSSEISSIVSVIKEVADQTNLLALNAAIEAARAGEQGRGFAVVADEVRKLAERTGESTLQIAQMIDRIQSGTRKAAAEMEASVARVREGVTLAHEAGDSVGAIQSSAERVVHAVDDIALALNEQSVASQEIAKNVERIAHMAEENSATVSQTAASARQMGELAVQLRQAVSRFKL